MCKPINSSHLSSCWRWQSCRTRGSTLPQAWPPSRSLTAVHTGPHRRWRRRCHRHTHDKALVSRCRCVGRPPPPLCNFHLSVHQQLQQRTETRRIFPAVHLNPSTVGLTFTCCGVGAGSWCWPCSQAHGATLALRGHRLLTVAEVLTNHLFTHSGPHIAHADPTRLRVPHVLVGVDFSIFCAGIFTKQRN